MYDVMLSQLNYLAGAALNAGEVMERIAGSSHPYIVPAQIFPTADGWLTMFVTHDKFWQIFCNVAGRPQWISDPVFATMRSRRENRSHVVAEIAKVLQEAPAIEWVRRLQPRGVVVAEVAGLQDALESDIVRARELVVTLGDGSLPLRAIANPIRMDGYQPDYDLPPTLDEHHDEILCGVSA